MRRESRRKKEKDNLNMLLYISGGILAVAIIAFIITFVGYSNKLNSESLKLNTEQIADLVPNNVEHDTEVTSTQVGKTVEESKNELENTKDVEETSQKTTSNVTKNKDNTTNSVNTSTASKKTTENKVTENIEKKEDPTFIKPVQGDIVKEYANDSMVYSETLKEWVTHLGVDIKADKATVVKAAEEGKVTAIKNDPRYGLTVIIEHNNGYKSLYANLLTAEFIKVGETVKEGQTIATVGSTGAFEIADGTHLHFEILKDNKNVDPNNLIK